MNNGLPIDLLTEKANAAFRQAARMVIERARQTGTLVIVWEGGQIVERTPESLEIELGFSREKAQGES